MTMAAQENSGNPHSIRADSENCPVCQDLLINMGRVFDMLEADHTNSTSDWLTVDEIAKELRISKSIVYRLIRNGELEAVNVTPSAEKIPQKGHYRIKKQALNQYLESKKVIPLQEKPRICTKRFPKVKNYLGL